MRCPAQACANDPGKTFEENRARHFRFAHPPILKNDGGFNDFIIMLIDTVGQFYLESVPLRLDGIEIDAFQHLAPVTAKARGAIVYRNAEHETRKDIAPATDEAPQGRPVRGATTLDIARTDHKVGILDLSQEVWKIARVMRKIGIHLKSRIILVFNGVFEPGDISCTQAQLPRAMHDLDLLILCLNLVGKFACSIRRVIVNDQYIRSGRIRIYLLKQWAQILVFVIRRNNDKRFHLSVSPEFDVAAAVCKSGRLSGVSKLPTPSVGGFCSSPCCMKIGVCWVAL